MNCPNQNLAKMLAVGVVATAMAVQALTVSREKPVDGVWTKDYEGAMEQARTRHHPLLIVCSNTGCTFCSRLSVAMDTALFKAWAQNRKILMVYLLKGEKHFPEALKFSKEGFKDVDKVPFVCVYWPYADGKERKLTFSGRRKMMPAGRDKLMQVELANSIDLVLEEYLKTLPGREDIETLARKTDKTVSAKVEGSGSVEVIPQNGLLCEGGLPVFMTAKAGADEAFAYWVGPDGNPVGYAAKLELPYESKAGEYTARFVKINDCKPPAIDPPVTSVCARMSERFVLPLKVDDSVRPLKFEAKGLPFGLSMNADTGVISGKTRRPGTFKVQVTATGANSAHPPATTMFPIVVLPKEAPGRR